MIHKRTNIHSINLKILNQDDVISSKSRATFQPSSWYSSCFLPCPVHTWRLQESRTQGQHHQKRNAVRPKWPCGGGVEIVLIWVDTSEVRMTGQPGYRSKGWLVQWGYVHPHVQEMTASTWLSDTPISYILTSFQNLWTDWDIQGIEGWSSRASEAHWSD